MIPFLKGLVFGLIYIFALGPAFFGLMQTSIQHGWKKGIAFALGTSLSDTMAVMIVLFGLGNFLENNTVKFWMTVIGFFVLVGYAIISWFQQPKMEIKLSATNETNYFKFFIQAFLLNGLNPFIIISWAAWVGTVTLEFEYDFDERFPFFIGVLVTLLLLDITKARLIQRIKHLITIKFIWYANRTIAVIVLIFSIQLVIYFFENFV